MGLWFVLTAYFCSAFVRSLFLSKFYIARLAYSNHLFRIRESSFRLRFKELYIIRIFKRNNLLVRSNTTPTPFIRSHVTMHTVTTRRRAEYVSRHLASFLRARLGNTIESFAHNRK